MKKPVRQTGGLANIEIIEAVIVEVAHRDAVVAIDVHPDSAVEHGAPVVCAVEQLPVVGIGFAQSLRRDIDKYGTLRRRDNFLARFPLAGLPGAGFAADPLGAPRADTLFLARTTPVDTRS